MTLVTYNHYYATETEPAGCQQGHICDYCEKFSEYEHPEFIDNGIDDPLEFCCLECKECWQDQNL